MFRMNPLDDTSISIPAFEAGSASSLNVSLDVSNLGKKSTQCHGTVLPIGLQPHAPTTVS